MRFGATFLEVFSAVHATTAFAVPPQEHRTPALERALAAWKDGSAPLPSGAMQVFLSCWGRLHGMITLEVFGHLQWVAVPDPEDLFRAEVASLLVALGLPAAPALDRGLLGGPAPARVHRPAGRRVTTLPVGDRCPDPRGASSSRRPVGGSPSRSGRWSAPAAPQRPAATWQRR